MKLKAVFFDRDNTLNEDPGYLHEPEKVVLMPWAGEALSKLRNKGFLLIVISNQSGIGRGFFRADAVESVNDRLSILLDKYGAAPDAYYYCPHRPEQNCLCRKPRTGLLDDALKDFDIDLSLSYMVGDKNSDVGFGIKAGIRTVSLGLSDAVLKPDCFADDLLSAAEWIIKDAEHKKD